MELNDIEKADFAVWLIKEHLFIDKRILAIACIKRLYKCSLKDARVFVDNVRTSAEQEFIENFIKEQKDAESSVPNPRPE